MTVFAHGNRTTGRSQNDAGRTQLRLLNSLTPLAPVTRAGVTAAQPVRGNSDPLARQSVRPY